MQQKKRLAACKLCLQAVSCDLQNKQIIFLFVVIKLGIVFLNHYQIRQIIKTNNEKNNFTNSINCSSC